MVHAEIRQHQPKQNGRPPHFRLFLVSDVGEHSIMTGAYHKVSSTGKEIARVLGTPLVRKLTPEEEALEQHHEERRLLRRQRLTEPLTAESSTEERAEL